MSGIDIVILLATGAVAGFAGGMLGLGGAFIMTPLQYLVYTNMGVTPDVAVKTAFGTSLLAILTTAISGAFRHHHERAVDWQVAVVMGGTGFVFALGGATLAAHVPAIPLKIAFGILGIASSIRMLFTTRERSEAATEKRRWVWALWAVPVGFACGLLGIGGGVLMIPILVIILKFKIRQAIGNSLAIMIFTSIGGIIGYIINGINAADSMAYSLGYINLTSWVLLAVPAAIMAQVGAMTSHRIRGNLLIYIFVAVIFYVGLRMTGLFEWLGWPL